MFLFNEALNKFYLWLHGIGHIVKDYSNNKREETSCHHYMGFSFHLGGGGVNYFRAHIHWRPTTRPKTKAVRGLLYNPSHCQDNTYHVLCYTSHGALAGTRHRSMGPPWGIDPSQHEQTLYHGATSHPLK